MRSSKENSAISQSLMHILQLATTLCLDDHDKDKFYVELQLLTIFLSESDMVITGGD